MELASLAPELQGRTLEFWRTNPRYVTASLTTLARENAYDGCLRMIEALRRADVCLDIRHWNCAIIAGQKTRQWTLCLGMLEAMAVAEVQPDHISFGNAISACGKVRKWDVAMHLLEDMHSASLELDRISCNGALSACEKAAQWPLALQLLRKDGLPPDVIAFNACISACEKGQQWQPAVALFQQMVDSKLTPSAVSFNSVMAACSRSPASWRRALHFLGAMSEVHLDNEVSFSACLTALAEAKQWQASVQLLEDMLSRRLVPGGIQTGACAQLLSKPQRWRLLRKMRRRWLSTSPEPLHSARGVPSSAAVGLGIALVPKPPGITSEDFAGEWDDSRQVFLASRLDKDASGILPLALNDAAAQWLQAQFAARLVEKEYLCLVEGFPLPGSGEISSRLKLLHRGLQTRTVVADDGRDALTEYTVVDRYTSPEALAGTEIMLLRVKTHTGRMHQIRVHLSSIGRPLLGDVTYGPGESAACPRLFLHCRRMRLRDLAGRSLSLSCELPADLESVLAQLEK